MSNKYRPHIQLVPLPLWQRNMRAVLPKSQWTKLRKAILERQGLRCSVCGKEEQESRKLHAHEEWSYEDDCRPAIARLVSISLLCWHCHAVEHWGVTKNLVAQGHLTERALTDTIEHFCRLNGADFDQFVAHEKEETERWQERSTREWRIEYGPYFEWVAGAYPGDPLNDCDWPKDLGGFSGRDIPPSIDEFYETLA